eukprot:GGOE01004238.1.p1 GENE.GGOE01004238.1~~GGOE01004238.1.p1  ORF type:complete len:699 (+),score=146.73 GGOE01004238.1:176-2098(+)
MFPGSWQGARPATGFPPSPLSPSPVLQSPSVNPPPMVSFQDAPPVASQRYRSRSGGPMPSYHSIRSSSPLFHSHPPGSVHANPHARHGTLTVRLSKAPSFAAADPKLADATIEVAVGQDSHRVPFPAPNLPWDHMFSFSPEVSERNGMLICSDQLQLTVWESEATGSQVPHDRAKLDISHLTCGHPSVFVIDLCGQSGFTLEANALDFGEPQFRGNRQVGMGVSMIAPVSSIGKLKVAMLRQKGFPPGKQISVELSIGSKRIHTNPCSTKKEQLGDKFTFFVKLRTTPIPDVHVACHPLMLRVLEGATVLGVAKVDLSECVEQQITRHKAEVTDEQGAVVGELELATKPVNFGRKDTKYRLSISPSPLGVAGGSPSKSLQDSHGDGDLQSNIRDLQQQLARMQREHAMAGAPNDAAYQLKLNMIIAQLDRAQIELQRIMAGDCLVIDHFGDRSGRSAVRAGRPPVGAAQRSQSAATSSPVADRHPPRPSLGVAPRGTGTAAWRSHSASQRSASPMGSEAAFSESPSVAVRRRKVNLEAVAAVESFFGVRSLSPGAGSRQGGGSGARGLAAPRSPLLLMESRSYVVDPRTGQAVNSGNSPRGGTGAISAPALGVTTYYRDPETGKELTPAEMKAKWGFTLE